MAKFTSILTTALGQGMLLESLSSASPLIFTKMEMGDGTLAENENILDLSALKHTTLDLAINEKSLTQTGKCSLVGLVDNSGVDVGFYAREIGVFAKLGDAGEEKLFAYSNAGNYSDYIPDKTSPLDENKINVTLAVGNVTNIEATIESLQYATLKNLNDALDAHDRNENAHSNLLRVTAMAETENGIQYTTQDGKKTNLSLWQKMKTVLTGTFTPTADSNTLGNQLDGLAHQIKAITGKSNWFDTPKMTLEQIATAIENVSAIAEYDVDDTSAWWFKLRGEPHVIIQGGNITQNKDNHTHTLPVSYPLCGAYSAATQKGNGGYSSAANVCCSFVSLSQVRIIASSNERVDGLSMLAIGW